MPTTPEIMLPGSAFWVLFEHMSQEHGLTMIDSELSDVCNAVDRMRAEWKANELKRQCRKCGGGDGAAVDPVNHPPHYTQHPSGVECIQVTECMSFCLGNAVKYIWRADLKNDAIEDLEKARWYVSREIERRKRQNAELTRPEAQ